jgi:hypothetical protein
MFKSAYADCIGSFIGLLPYIPANRMQPGRIITEYEVLSDRLFGAFKPFSLWASCEELLIRVLRQNTSLYSQTIDSAAFLISLFFIFLLFRYVFIKK